MSGRPEVLPDGRENLTGDLREGERIWWARSDSRLATGLEVALMRAPSALPVRRRDGFTAPVRAAIHRGDAVECPICGGRFRHFGQRWNTPNVVCWRCGAQERHRCLWLLLTGQRP